MPCNQPFRDDSSQILLWKIASCLAEGGGLGGFGVASFNGRTGVVTLTAGDVITALGCTPACDNNVVTSFNGRQGVVTLTEADVSGVADGRYVLKSGDTMTGALTIGNGVLVANDPALELSQTWNNAAVNFKALTLNVTNTAAGSGSMLLDVQQDGITRFTIFENGSLVRFLSQDQTNTGLELFLRKRGTAVDATAAVASGGGLATIWFSGWNGASQVQAAGIRTIAAELFTGVANGARMELLTTAIGATSTQINLLLSNTGQSLFRDGTAALPSLSFQSDTNTGFYLTGAGDTIGFSTGGASRMVLDSVGTLVIGGGSMTGLMFFADGLLSDVKFVGTSTPGPIWSFVNTGSGAGTRLYVEDANNSSIRHTFDFRGGGGAVLVLCGTSDGKVGIGTTTPSKALTLASGLAIAMNSGANQRAGDVVLIAGTRTVANTTVTANTRVFLTRKVSGGTLGTAITYTVIAATSFTVNSDSALDTSTFSYLLIEVP